MASSLLSSGREGLEKVRAKPWASPLGKALEVSSKVVGAVEGFVPGANIIGGALAFGATLLNPEPSMADLQKDLGDIKALLKGTNSRAAQQGLEKVQLELEEKIAHPIGEVKVAFQDLRGDLKGILVEIRESYKKNSNLISGIRDVINKTYLVVVDTRFKVSLSATVALLTKLISGRH